MAAATRYLDIKGGDAHWRLALARDRRTGDYPMTQVTKPCPHCGGPAQVVYAPAKDVWYVQCDDDEQCPLFDAMGARDTAIAAWNTRPLEDALRARIAELEAELASKSMPEWADQYTKAKGIRMFIEEVNRRAERNMEHTGVVSGAHWNAIRQVSAEWGIDTPPPTPRGVPVEST
jgi:hypothetical protein